MTRPRGEHLLEAVFAVLATQGVDALSMRTVAKAAGVSLAQVQYYFRTKADLVAAAFDHSGDQFLATVEAAGVTTLAQLRAVVDAWLPLDDEREQRARVWLAFAATATADEQLAARAAKLDADLRAWFVRTLGTLQSAGEVRESLDVYAAGAQLLALVDGLTMQLLVLPRARRETVVAKVVGAWFGSV